MSFFDRFLTEVKFFLIDRANRTRFSETRSLSDQNCMLKNFKFLKVTEKIYVNSRLVSAPAQKFQICSDSKTGFRFGIWITLRAKMSPTPPLKSPGLPRYNNLGQIS